MKTPSHTWSYLGQDTLRPARISGLNSQLPQAFKNSWAPYPPPHKLSFRYSSGNAVREESTGWQDGGKLGLCASSAYHQRCKGALCRLICHCKTWMQAPVPPDQIPSWDMSKKDRGNSLNSFTGKIYMLHGGFFSQKVSSIHSILVYIKYKTSNDQCLLRACGTGSWAKTFLHSITYLLGKRGCKQTPNSFLTFPGNQYSPQHGWGGAHVDGHLACWFSKFPIRALTLSPCSQSHPRCKCGCDRFQTNLCLVGKRKSRYSYWSSHCIHT